MADILGYCRETISRHMKELVFDDLIKEQAAQKFPKRLFEKSGML
ncbi:hypothetical protein [Calothrix sp. NIES-2100]